MKLGRMLLFLGALAFATLPATNSLMAHEGEHDCEHEEHCDLHHENEHDPVMTRVCHFDHPDAYVGTAYEMTLKEAEFHRTNHPDDCRSFDVKLDGTHTCRCRV